MSICVLSVGQCGFDGPRIASLCRSALGATVEHSDTARDALDRCRRNSFDLVLVNRVLDQDGSSGLELIRDLLAAGTAGSVMLVSNYDDAQNAAVALGASRGFGKDSLGKRAVVELLKGAVWKISERTANPDQAGRDVSA